MPAEEQKDASGEGEPADHSAHLASTWSISAAPSRITRSPHGVTRTASGVLPSVSARSARATRVPGHTGSTGSGGVGATALHPVTNASGRLSSDRRTSVGHACKAFILHRLRLLHGLDLPSGSVGIRLGLALALAASDHGPQKDRDHEADDAHEVEGGHFAPQPLISAVRESPLPPIMATM